jgi:hypothetical protein
VSVQTSHRPFGDGWEIDRGTGCLVPEIQRRGFEEGIWGDRSCLQMILMEEGEERRREREM